MKKYFGKLALGISVMIFMIGMMGILFSTDLSKRKGEKAIQANGGSMQTAKYNLIIESSRENYRIAGSILAILGGAGFITFAGIIYHNMED